MINSQPRGPWRSRCARAWRVLPVAVCVLLAVPSLSFAQWATNGNNINNTNTGNVGVGTTTPAQKLDVMGNVKAKGLDLQGGALWNGYVTQNPWDLSVSNYNGSAIGLSTNRLLGATSGRYTVTATGFPLNLTPFDGLYDQWAEVAQGATGVYEIDFNPQLGWTANTTTGFVYVNGLVAMSFYSQNFATNITVEFYQRVAATGTDQWNTIYTTTTNTQNLVVVKTIPNSNYVKKIRFTVSSATTPVWLTELEWFSTRENRRDQYASILSYSAFPQEFASQELRFRNSAWSTVSAIKNTGDAYFGVGSGNVGIGTNAPTAKLDVNGNVNVSGNISAKYQDVAEWVPAKRTLPAGTVLVLDTDRPNYVRASSRSYDTHVAGVVSDQPGIILGEAGDDKLKVATTGRVKVHVDATNTPIRIGDLLVTGNKFGTAVTSQPMKIQGRKLHQPGTILGKALEPLASGEGEILVLLSLQ
jgi:hypothetical protein